MELLAYSIETSKYTDPSSLVDKEARQSVDGVYPLGLDQTALKNQKAQASHSYYNGYATSVV